MGDSDDAVKTSND